MVNLCKPEVKSTKALKNKLLLSISHKNRVVDEATKSRQWTADSRKEAYLNSSRADGQCFSAMSTVIIISTMSSLAMGYEHSFDSGDHFIHGDYMSTPAVELLFVCCCVLVMFQLVLELRLRLIEPSLVFVQSGLCGLRSLFQCRQLAYALGNLTTHTHKADQYS